MVVAQGQDMEHIDTWLFSKGGPWNMLTLGCLYTGVEIGGHIWDTAPTIFWLAPSMCLCVGTQKYVLSNFIKMN